MENRPRTYVYKPRPVQAMRITDQNIDAVAKWCGGTILMSDTGQSVVLPILGDIVVSFGDYVVKNAKGVFIPYDKNEFVRNYELIGWEHERDSDMFPAPKTRSTGPECGQLYTMLKDRFPGIAVDVQNGAPGLVGLVYSMRDPLRGKVIDFAVDGDFERQVEFWNNEEEQEEIGVTEFYRKHQEAAAAAGKAQRE
ncbi:MAG TPA: hypothetical protein VLH38_03345 [Patescibacteria group bacterium]|nr:hypothetical protein [Patescibacteria group bacterium]